MERMKASPHMTGRDTVCPGMDLRDWFAGQAMIGIFIHDTEETMSFRDIAVHAYEAADEMMGRRKR